MAATQQATLDWVGTQVHDGTPSGNPEPTRCKAKRGTLSGGGVFFELVDGEYEPRHVKYVIKKKDTVSDFWGVIFTRGEETVAVSEPKLREAVYDRDCPKWVPALYESEADDGEAYWIPHPKHDGKARYSLTFRSAPNSPSDLSFERMSGNGSQKAVNKFLDGRGDGLVDHHLGGIASWKTGFVARYKGKIVSTITLHHYHPSTNGVEIAITRLANHEVAPKNTSTWMIGRARRWAERAGYERIASYADLDLNEGTVYHAAGFEPVGEPEEVEGKDWTGDDTKWTRQKYLAKLNPEKYSEKSEQWATKTVETRGVA